MISRRHAAAHGDEILERAPGHRADGELVDRHAIDAAARTRQRPHRRPCRRHNASSRDHQPLPQRIARHHAVHVGKMCHPGKVVDMGKTDRAVKGRMGVAGRDPACEAAFPSRAFFGSYPCADRHKSWTLIVHSTMLRKVLCTVEWPCQQLADFSGKSATRFAPSPSNCYPDGSRFCSEPDARELSWIPSPF